jgi:hypothetical protein
VLLTADLFAARLPERSAFFCGCPLHERHHIRSGCDVQQAGLDFRVSGLAPQRNRTEYGRTQ